jgi:hypothetical protein
MRQRGRAFGVLIGTAVLLGCGGGSGDGGVVAPTVTADFLADEPTPPASTVAMEKGAASSDLVTVRVDVTGVSDVYGAAFEVAFDGTLADFVGFTKGTFFEQGAHVPTYQVSSPGSGQIVVGITRNGAVPGVGTTASRTVVNLTFRVKRAGTGDVTLPDAVLYDAQIQPQPVAGISWHTGSLHGN